MLPPNPISRTQARSGFTIIEMMVGVSLMAVIVFALYNMFNQTQKALRSNVTQVDVLESGRAAVEMISRELEQVGACNLGQGINLYAGLIPVATPVVQTEADAPGVPLRTNVLQELFFLTPMTNVWIGTGYRVMNAESGVGTLHRFTVATNATRLTFTNLTRAFADAPLTNFHRVADGIIHLRILAFDEVGLPITYNSTNRYPSASEQISRIPGVRETRLTFTSNALPAYLELELGVLEPNTLVRYNALRDGPPGAAARFLQQRASKVHLFRQRIPVRTALK